MPRSLGVTCRKSESMKLFIGNLSYDTSETEIRSLFEPFEPILEFVRPLNRETGQPRGFAFVSLLDEEKGLAAIESLDGTELGGRKLRVNEAEDRAPAPRPPRMWAGHDDLDHGPKKRVDDRPTGKDGRKVTYKSI